MESTIRIRAPGRICLFGEHQDYLGYPTISMAIDRYIFLEAKRDLNNHLIINMPDINDKCDIPLSSRELEYLSDRDYLRSGYNQFIRREIQFNKGYKVKIYSNIPINAGVSSSSAFVIAWLYFLNLISKSNLPKLELAKLGYDTEVTEFREAGGMMDHYTSVFGGILYLQARENDIIMKNFPLKLSGFVLGDSLEKKATVDDLRNVKRKSIKAFNELRKIYPEFDQYLTELTLIEPFLYQLSSELRKKIVGNLINRDLTESALNLVENFYKKLDRDVTMKESLNFYHKLGELINLHHFHLRENIGVSTIKIETMISNSLKKGALGAKINGSGFGGTIFAFNPKNQLDIKSAIEEVDGKAYLVSTSNGVEQY